MLFKTVKSMLALLMLGTLTLTAAENVIEKFKDQTIDTATFKKPWKNIYSNSFYMFTSKAQAQAGKTIEFRADVTTLAGSAPLNASWRLSTDNGKKLQFTRKFKSVPAQVGKAVQLVCRLEIPKLEGIHNFNVSLGFARPGDMHCAWQLKNMRFVSIPSAAPAKNKKEKK